MGVKVGAIFDGSFRVGHAVRRLTAQSAELGT
jgi:hypothetical protein